MLPLGGWIVKKTAGDEYCQCKVTLIGSFDFRREGNILFFYDLFIGIRPARLSEIRNLGAFRKEVKRYYKALICVG